MIMASAGKKRKTQKVISHLFSSVLVPWIGIGSPGCSGLRAEKEPSRRYHSIIESGQARVLIFPCSSTAKPSGNKFYLLHFGTNSRWTTHTEERDSLYFSLFMRKCAKEGLLSDGNAVIGSQAGKDWAVAKSAVEELVLHSGEMLVIHSAGGTARAPAAISGPGPPLSDAASS